MTQIKLNGAANVDRVNFYGNARDGVYIDITDKDGISRHSQRLTDVELARLTNTCTRQDDGRAV